MEHWLLQVLLENRKRRTSKDGTRYEWAQIIQLRVEERMLEVSKPKRL
jgi:hypothetical protein